MADRFFDEHKGILFTKSDGEVTYDEMFSRMKNLVQLSEFTKDLKILEDARGATALFNVSELHKLLENLEDILKAFTSVRHAVLHSDPKATAYALMVKQFDNLRKYKIMVFSTEAAALSWLNES
ncbi:MAG: hypothetical protein PHP04_03285 [Bacteroidales bacterium]|nr:hypothetical protein [Bacteroidales bacterium]HNW72407.1 hypothetical protein [Bacteroidales bacterium]HPS49468.1 hypothetical protein [Bacteroidales bacterium]